MGFDPIRSKGRVATFDAQQKPLDASSVGAGSSFMGAIEIEWGDPADTPNAAEQIDKMLAAASDIRGFIYSELKDITGLTETGSKACTASVGT